jgi:hypothetical protein
MEVLSRMCDWKTAASRYFDKGQQQYQISPGKCFNLCMGCSEILHNHPFCFTGEVQQKNTWIILLSINVHFVLFLY